MEPEAIYYFWALALLAFNLIAWGLNFISLPGNWIIVLATLGFTVFVPAPAGAGVQWAGVVALIVLALFAEFLEFVAGAMGAARLGASRRAMVLAVLGAIVGSVMGAIVGVPIPIVGPMIGAVGGGMVGAFVGAYLGEYSTGRPERERLRIGAGAAVGKLLGTLGKLVVGAIMVVVATASSLL